MESKAEYDKQYRQDNKEYIKEQRKRYYEDNKKNIIEKVKQYQTDNKQSIPKRNKQYRNNNSEHIAEYNIRYRQDNKEAIAEYIKEYYKQYAKDNKDTLKGKAKQYQKEHLQEACIRNKKRDAIKHLLPATLTIAQWENIKLYFNNTCCYCGKELPLAQEHFIALSMGGEYTHNNIISACKSCNSSKQDRDFFVWYPMQPYYSKKREKKILKYLGYENKMQQLALM